ncbi:hypothetical protein [Streptomyces griseoluteus]|uniref:hypothetical protein n=1 Tax=Streptomyces griseoluteus TaxID=29306 RepID=UPI003652D39C
MPTTATTGKSAPRSAAEAAHHLARQGKHVHIVSEGQGVCLKGRCNLVPVLPTQWRHG